MPAREGSSAWCVVLAVLVGGCGGYWPLRKPSGHQWTPNPSSEWSVQSPTRLSEASPLEDTQSHVTVAIEFMDRRQTREVFHADLLARHIQPLRIRIDNGSRQAYQFRKAGVGVPRVSAEEAAGCVSVHPVVAAARWVRWAAFLLPGMFFDTVIEPASTLDFPGIHEASQWPVTAGRQAIREEFLRREIPDGTVSAEAVLEGALFTRPLPRGQAVPVSLEDLSTHEPLRFEVPIPLPTDRLMRSYVEPEEVVWNVAVTSAKAIATWHVISVDPAHRIIAAHKTSGWFWGRPTPLTIMLSGGQEAQTTVMLESAMARATTDRDGRHSRTIDAFFDRLDRRLPPPPPPPAASSDASPAETSKPWWQEDAS